MIFTLSVQEAVMLLKQFAQMQAGSLDGFYKPIETFLAKNSKSIDHKELVITVKSFAMVSAVNLNYDVSKLFVKIQR